MYYKVTGSTVCTSITYCDALVKFVHFSDSRVSIMVPEVLEQVVGKQSIQLQEEVVHSHIQMQTELLRG